MARCGAGDECPVTLSTTGFTVAVILSVIKTLGCSEIIREPDVLPECQVMTECDGNETELELNNFSVLDSSTGIVEVNLNGTCESSLNVYLITKFGSPSSYLDYNCKMPEGVTSLNCCHQQVTLHFLIPGNYTIENKSQKPLAQFNVETNYSRENLREDCDFFTYYGLISERYNNIWIRLKPFHMNNILKIYLAEDGCKTRNETDFWWKVEIKENQYDNVIIERNVHGNGSVDCNISEFKGYKTLHCVIFGQRLSCLTIRREISNYVTYYPGLCKEEKRIRIVHVSYEEKHAPTKPATNILATTSVMFLIAIPLIAAAAYFLMILCYLDSGDHTEAEKGGRGTAVFPDMKYKILLLYPQDCKHFMITMKHLKNFLESYNCFEIYDCFDPRRMEEIAPDPQGWISKLLSQKDVKVVLSETETAVFHQTAVREKCVVHYASPIPYNMLFTYGLKMLLQSIRPHEYKRIFLFRFDDIRQENEKLDLAHYQRFILPNHLNNLISSITNINVITLGETEDSRSLKELKDSIEEFEKFICSNPKYHMTLFDNLTRIM